MKTAVIRTLDADRFNIGTRQRSRFYSMSDERLDAISPGKCLALGAVWDGSLEPFINTAIENLGALVAPGLTPGHTLGAEPTPVQRQLLGRTWCDGVLRAIGAAVHELRTGERTDDDVNLEEVHKHTRSLGEAIASGQVGGARQAFDSLKGAYDAISRSRSKSRIGDSNNWATNWLSRSRAHTADGQSRFAKVGQALLADTLRARTQSPGVSSVEAMRRGQAAGVNTAAAINKANAEFWDARR